MLCAWSSDTQFDGTGDICHQLRAHEAARRKTCPVTEQWFGPAPRALAHPSPASTGKTYLCCPFVTLLRGSCSKRLMRACFRESGAFKKRIILFSLHPACFGPFYGLSSLCPTARSSDFLAKCLVCSSECGQPQSPASQWEWCACRGFHAEFWGERLCTEGEGFPEQSPVPPPPIRLIPVQGADWGWEGFKSLRQPFAVAVCILVRGIILCKVACFAGHTIGQVCNCERGNTVTLTVRWSHCTDSLSGARGGAFFQPPSPCPVVIGLVSIEPSKTGGGGGVQTIFFMRFVLIASCPHVQ